MRRLNKNQREAAGFIAAVVTLIGVMMAVIIGAIVFFAFSDGTDTQITDIYTDTITGAVDIWVPLTRTPGSDAQYSVTLTNATATRSVSAGATGYQYVAGNNTMRVDTVALNNSDVQIDVDYYDRGHDVTSDIVLYAVTVFALLAIIPLIMVGGLMLRSLGFMGGGEMV